VAFLNCGLTEEAYAASSLSLETIGPYLYRTTEDLGGYMGLLLYAFGFQHREAGDTPTGMVTPVEYADLRSRYLYEAISTNIAPGQASVALLLMAVLSQVNTCRLLIPAIAGNNHEAVFKMQFVGLYQAASSLQTILSVHKLTPLLTPQAEDWISDMLRFQPIRSVRKKEQLRNTLLHYGVEARVADSLSGSDRLDQLVEVYFAQRSYASVLEDVNLGLICLADGLHRMLVDGVSPQGSL
jgi:hypothetical protein